MSLVNPIGQTNFRRNDPIRLFDQNTSQLYKRSQIKSNDEYLQWLMSLSTKEKKIVKERQFQTFSWFTNLSIHYSI